MEKLHLLVESTGSKKQSLFSLIIDKISYLRAGFGPSPDGGIGRRAGLKHQCRKASRFEPESGYPLTLQIPCKSMICKGFFFLRVLIRC